MLSKSLGKVAFDALYDGRSGYDHYIGFALVRGSQRKRYLSEKDEVAEASYTNVRTVSVTVEECPPGDYTHTHTHTHTHIHTYTHTHTHTHTHTLTLTHSHTRAAGDYLIIPTTFDPVPGLGFTIKVFSSSEVEMIDTRGGKDVMVFEAGDDQIDQQVMNPKP